MYLKKANYPYPTGTKRKQTNLNIFLKSKKKNLKKKTCSLTQQCVFFLQQLMIKKPKLKIYKFRKKGT